MTDNQDSSHILIENDSSSQGADFALTEGRGLRGRIFRWDELSRGISKTGTPPIKFPRGSVRLPADFSALNANLIHDKYQPVARFTGLSEDEQGVVAEFAVAATDEGDYLLAEVAAGRMQSLSPEVRDLIRNGDTAVSAVLTGASFVPVGAFASNALFSLADEDKALSPEEQIQKAEDLLTAAKAQLTQTPEADEAEANTTPDSPEADEDALSETPTKENTVEDFAVMPEGVGSAPEAKKADTSASALFKSLASLNNSGTPVAADFALADITGAQIGSDIEQPQWLGEVYAERTYTQKVLPLFGHGDLRSYTITGFRWTKTPEVGLYSGNKAEIPSDTVDTEAYSVTAQRIAGGHDIDRRFRDFGNEAFWDGYFRHMASSYAKVSDDYVFNLIEGVADDNVVTVDDEATDAFDWLVDAAFQVEENGATPTFALVAPAVLKQILKTRDGKDMLEFFNATFGLTGGTFGGFQVIPHAGVAAAGHKMIVGSRDAATVYELPGSPIRVEGIDVAKAGIDPALYGYLAVTINKPNGLVVVDGDAA